MANTYSDALMAFGATMNKTNGGTDVIQAEIVELKSADACKYTILHQGNKMEAFAANGSKYNPKDQVYVLIPGNNYSADKIIISGIPSSNDNKEIDENSRRYITVTDDILNCGGLSWNLSSYVDEERDIEILDGNAATLLHEYLKDTSNFALSVNIRTNLDNNRKVSGNYGISIVFPFVRTNADGTTENIFKEFTLDVPHMLGSPYNFINTTTQTLDFVLSQTENEKYKEGGIPSIKIFTNGFPQESDKTKYRDDIFLSNLKLSVTRQLTEEEVQKTMLALVATPDSVFLRKDVGATKTITPYLVLNGKEVDVKGYNCYWAYEDVDVKQNNKFYCKQFGNGWHCLNEKLYSKEPDKEIEDDIGIFEYVTNKYEYTVSEEDIKSKDIIFRCVLVNAKERYDAKITIRNLNAAIQTEIICANADANNVGNVGPVKLTFTAYFPLITSALNKEDFTTTWIRKDKNNNQIEEYLEEKEVQYKDNIYTQDVLLYASSIDTRNVISCILKYKDGKIWGAASIQLNTGNPAEFYTVLNNGERLFYYDEDGDSPLNENYDKITSEPILIAPLTFTVYNKDGKEIDEDEYSGGVNIVWKIPKNSLFVIDSNLIDNTTDDEKYYIVRGQRNLPYKIASVYDVNKIDNTIILETRFHGIEMRNVTNIQFVKDGNSGTNGTNYKAVALINGRAYNEIIIDEENNIRPYKVKFIYAEGSETEKGKWYVYNAVENKIVELNDYHLNVGVKVLSQDAVSFNISRILVVDKSNNNSIINIKNNEIILNEDTEWKDDSVNIIELEVKVTHNDNQRDWSVFCFFPIELIKVKNIDNFKVPNIQGDFDVKVPDIRGGFEEVIYDTEGMNPKYPNENFYYIESSDSLDPIKNVVWTSSENLTLRAISAGSSYYEVKPKNYWNNGDTKNYIKTKCGDITYIKPIMFMLNRYGLKSLNGWDGNKIYMDDKNEEYILAPQVGAGRKESDNSFTGILMGTRKRKSEDKTEEDVGLYGYNSGVQTIFMDAEDGSLVLGSTKSKETEKINAGGRIVIDPKKDSVIFSDNYYKPEYYDAAGKLTKEYDTYEKLDKPNPENPNCHYKYVPNDYINKEGLEINFTQPFIRYGSGNFAIDPEGCLEASNASISGEVTATSGEIAGWTIKNDYFYNEGKDGDKSYYAGIGVYGKEHAFYAGTHAPGKGGDTRYSEFSVSHAGVLTATNANITGSINADDGTISTWTIDNNGIWHRKGFTGVDINNPKTDNMSYFSILQEDGSICIYHDKYNGTGWVHDGGAKAAFSYGGGVTAESGKIGGNDFTSEGFTLNNGSIELGKTKITSSKLSSSVCEFTGGSIGGWDIYDGYLKTDYADGITESTTIQLNKNKISFDSSGIEGQSTEVKSSFQVSLHKIELKNSNLININSNNIQISGSVSYNNGIFDINGMDYMPVFRINSGDFYLYGTKVYKDSNGYLYCK